MNLLEHDFYKTENFLEAYNELNYEIIETPSAQLDEEENPQHFPTCAIYFSSNGWYDREISESFKKMFWEKNRYEWKRNLLKKAQKHIFVRDIHLTWYIKGINSTINTQEKLIDFLREQTKGYRVITLGASAGGYMAALAGIKLDAYKIFSFCGQFALRFSHVDMEKEGNIENLVREYKGNSLYYFTSRDFINDVPEYNFALNCDSVKTFMFKTDTHGIPFPVSALGGVLNMKKSKLNTLYKHYKNKQINILKFSFNVSGIKFIFPILRDSIRHFRKFSRNAFK